MSGRQADPSRRSYFATTAAVLAADQASKLAADAWLAGREPVTVIPRLFDLAYSRNAGGLFGFFRGLPDPWRLILLTLVPLVAIALISWFLVRGEDEDRRTLWGLALILGGAVGNLVDRVFRGEVIDFLDVYVSSPRLAGWLIETFGTAHWPTFNVADSAIVVGAGLLLLTVARPETGGSGSRAPTAGSAGA